MSEKMHISQTCCELLHTMHQWRACIWTACWQFKLL